MLLGAPGLTTRLEQRVSLLGARVLLGAPGLTTRMLLGNAVPATTSAHGGSQSAGPATKSKV